ncbi:hypothetical protein OESDEN_07585 [Oesophagostomum dentatum]|uniref:7TM GPCR serpentine receptor class x (Srx) domain-containing protein n=1 Tax=Oesophagostomum dentatum TaxID=61180 RepID=A0A0B1T4L6_OESDE|nr:hypothetical protein OESDEN_07585 [Oesophagostomum dentatum]
MLCFPSLVHTYSVYVSLFLQCFWIHRFSYNLPAEFGMALGNIVGGMIYVGGVLTQVLASVNRLIASFSIHLYNKLCTLRRTLVLLVLCWIGTFSLAAVYFFNGIGYIFHEDVLIWAHDGQEVSIQAFEIVGYIVYASTATMFTLNIVTFVKLIMLTKAIRG